MMRPSAFRRAILSALSTVPDGYMQRIDGLRCERGIIETDWWFFRSRLRMMERSGLIRSKPTASLWPSCDGMPSFAITTAGRSALSKETGDSGLKADNAAQCYPSIQEDGSQ